VNLFIPSSYDGQTNVPLVILLHGYFASGAGEESYLHFQPLAQARGFLYCYPDSPADRAGNPFWNATDGCCDFFNTGVDDAGYLRGLVEEIERQFAVDRKRVYLIGHSNGGFMAYRMACQSADLIAGIASLAGLTFLYPSNCAPSQPVNILHIHGTADDIVPYAGGAVTTSGLSISFPSNLPPFPGVLQDVQTWATYNGASGPETDPAPSLDLTTDVAGPDTLITRYTNSPPGGTVELWTIIDGSHHPTLSTQFPALVIDWLLANSKP
jgi:polyhydroxybutyrate depolymerase